MARLREHNPDDPHEPDIGDIGDQFDDDLDLPDMTEPNVYAAHDAAIGRVNLLAGVYKIVMKPYPNPGPVQQPEEYGQRAKVKAAVCDALTKSIEVLMATPMPGSADAAAIQEAVMKRQLARQRER